MVVRAWHVLVLALVIAAAVVGFLVIGGDDDGQNAALGPNAVTATGTYSAAPTRDCMIAAGEKVQSEAEAEATLVFPEIQQQLFWHRGKALDSGSGAFIAFTRDPGSATHLAGRLVLAEYSMGATDDEARNAVGQRGNVVWNWTITPDPALTNLLERCLR